MRLRLHVFPPRRTNPGWFGEAGPGLPPSAPPLLREGPEGPRAPSLRPFPLPPGPHLPPRRCRRKSRPCGRRGLAGTPPGGGGGAAVAMATRSKKPRLPPPRLFAPVRGDAGGAVTWPPLGAGLTLAPRPLRPGAAAGRAEPRGQAWASSSPSSGASSGTKVGAGGSGPGRAGFPSARGSPAAQLAPSPPLRPGRPRGL